MFRPPVGQRRGLPKLLLPAAVLSVTALLLLVPTDYNTAHAVSISSSSSSSSKADKSQTAAAAPASPVQVTLYVMSQCPDAKFCQNAFKPVLETLPSVAAVRTEYIARLGDEDKVNCMHGAAECDGNKQQLCLQHHLAKDHNRKYFAALLCHAKGMVNDAKHLQDCMQSAAVDASTQAEVLKCIDGTLGATLQVDSAKQVTANSVVKSCTVFIDGTKRCIRDGGTWYDCPGGSDTQSFIKSICDAHKAKAGSASAECQAALGQPAPAA